MSWEQGREMIWGLHGNAIYIHCTIHEWRNHFWAEKFVLWLHCKTRRIQLFRERDKKMGKKKRTASNSLSSREGIERESNNERGCLHVSHFLKPVFWYKTPTFTFSADSFFYGLEEQSYMQRERVREKGKRFGKLPWKDLENYPNPSWAIYYWLAAC